jgi:hypothetical protein
MTDELRRLSERSIRKMSNAEALDHIAQLIDFSGDAAFARGVERALTLLLELEKRVLPEQGAVIHYFRANAWSIKAELAGHKRSWAWEQPERQQEILSLSRAASHEGFDKLDAIRRCQILTNRANNLNSMGRFIDAIESWDKALRIIPRFAMATGNRALGLNDYASALFEPGHSGILWLHAYDAAVEASKTDALFECNYSHETLAIFARLAANIAKNIPVEHIRQCQKMDGFSLGRSKRERAYRSWCLDERLFLNPLNDLGPFSIAARDVLTLPSLTEAGPTKYDGSVPLIIGFYNQLKQEFAAARFLLFEGLMDDRVHFSDRGVRIYNTLDYPSYSFAMERVRASFRIAYSLLDKVAFMVNYYWNLGKKQDFINFRNVWMADGKKTLHPAFENYANWPLRGLFWLSKEIHDDELKREVGYDARELHDLRNHLEHKYLQVHEGWAMAALINRSVAGELGKSISSDEMRAKALRVMKIARSALCYLSLAIACEEAIRKSERPAGAIMSIPLSIWDDARKRPL